MKGLAPQQLVEITEFVQKHHVFGVVEDENRIKGNLGYCIKYIDACYDSREGDYWAVTFRGAGTASFSTNSFGIFNEKPSDFSYDNLYDWIMAFLKYEWEPTEPTYGFMWDKNTGPLHNSFPNGALETPWSDVDMIEAYCADLDDRSPQDTQDACAWIGDYRETKDKVTKK